MNQIRTKQDLEKFKEAALEKIKVRQAGGKTMIVVRMGTCGIASGAREVMVAIIDELSKRNLTDVLVTQAGCKGICEYEPVVEVFKPDALPVCYGKINANGARKIVVSHIINNQVIKEWILD